MFQIFIILQICIRWFWHILRFISNNLTSSQSEHRCDSIFSILFMNQSESVVAVVTVVKVVTVVTVVTVDSCDSCDSLQL